MKLYLAGLALLTAATATAESATLWGSSELGALEEFRAALLEDYPPTLAGCFADDESKSAESLASQCAAAEDEGVCMYANVLLIDAGIMYCTGVNSLIKCLNTDAALASAAKNGTHAAVSECLGTSGGVP